jgi:hypothetical protein
MLSRLQRYYGDSVDCQWFSSSSLVGISCFATTAPDTEDRSQELVAQDLPSGYFQRIYPGHDSQSLLTSFNLPSIPSPTTACPFPCFGIGVLLHPKQILYVYPAGKSQGLQDGRRVEEGSKSSRVLPDRFGRIEFAYATDWNFSSGCSPHVLADHAVTTFGYWAVTLPRPGLSPG